MDVTAGVDNRAVWASDDASCKRGCLSTDWEQHPASETTAEQVKVATKSPPVTCWMKTESLKVFRHQEKRLGARPGLCEAVHFIVVVV